MQGPGRIAVAGMAAGLLAGCLPADARRADRYELSSMRPSHVVPKSSPAQVVRVFRQICAEHAGAPAATPDRLRAAGYVEAPTRGAGRSFVVDDRRPLVMLADHAGGPHCAVAAISRTGQTRAVADMVAADYPGARPTDPGPTGPGTESAWAVGQGLTLYTMRSGAPLPDTTYMLAIGRV